MIWRVQLHQFSGRRNPEWIMTESQAREFYRYKLSFYHQPGLQGEFAQGDYQLERLEDGFPDCAYSYHIGKTHVLVNDRHGQNWYVHDGAIWNWLNSQFPAIASPTSDKAVRHVEIDQIMVQLCRVWKEHYPELRLGQIIYALNDGHDPFYLDDARLMTLLREKQ